MATSKRIRPRHEGAPRKPLKKVRSLEIHRSVQGEKIRQYFTIGDPYRDRLVAGSRWRMLIIILILLFAIFLIIQLSQRI